MLWRAEMICQKCRKDYSAYEQWCPRCGERNEHLIEKEPTAEEPSEVQGDHFADVSKKVISSM